MMIKVFVLLLLPIYVFGKKTVDLSVGTSFESNPLYIDKTDIGDSLFFIKNYIYYLTKASNLQLEFEMDVEYKKYSQISEADNIEYYTQIGFPMLKKENFNFKIYGDIEQRSDPPDEFGGEINTRNKIGSGLEIDWALSSKYSVDINFRTSVETFKEISFKYLQNQRNFGRVQLNYNFLPETKFFMAVQGGTDIYPDGLINVSNTSQRSNDSIYGRFESGISGRMTEYSRINASVGYEIRDHEDSENFSEPVFTVSFEEQISPQDIILAGYDYSVSDSYYTAWKLEQAIFLGYSKVIGDQYLFSTRLSYIYRSFSNPNRREDQRLLGVFSLEYSYRPTYLIVAEAMGDFLFSDSYNQSSGTVFDRAASYEYLSFSISIKKSF